MSKRTGHKKQCRKQRPASSRKPTYKLAPGDIEMISDELIAYHHLFDSVFYRREQRYWSRFYLCGQLSDLERKTIEPMILALSGPDANRVRAVQQFIGQGRWDTEKYMIQHQALVAEELGDPNGIVIVDGSGFPKQGQDSVGVARQYCGILGKVANCQEGVFAVYVSPMGRAFLDVRLYLPEEWFDAAHRGQWEKCGIPDEVVFHTEPELALDMVKGLVKRNALPFQWVAADAHFGENPAWLDGISALGKWYFAEVPCDTRIWFRTPRVELPRPGPLGRPRTRPRLAQNTPRPQEMRKVAAGLPQSAWTRYSFKEGSKGPQVAEFAFLRVTTIRNGLPGPRVWAVFRRSLGLRPEFKFYLSNAPLTCVQRDLARLSGMRWPVETLLAEGKGEVGLDHYETRSWCGWHHHMGQSFMAHYFLVRLQIKFKKNTRVDYCPDASVSCRCS